MRRRSSKGICPSCVLYCTADPEQCTWSTEFACDRCRRLDKHCHPRKSSTIKDETSDSASQSELFGVSDSAASAALALTELSAANNGDDRPSPPARPEPAPYKPTLPHVNPYQIPGTLRSYITDVMVEAEVKRLSPVSTRTTYFPEARQEVPMIRTHERSPPQPPPRQPPQHSPRMESSYQPHNQHSIPLPQSNSMTILNDQLKNMSNHKKKQSRKYLPIQPLLTFRGNNPHGNVGTYKCSRCREFKAKVLPLPLSCKILTNSVFLHKATVRANVVP